MSQSIGPIINTGPITPPGELEVGEIPFQLWQQLQNPAQTVMPLTRRTVVPRSPTYRRLPLGPLPQDLPVDEPRRILVARRQLAPRPQVTEAQPPIPQLSQPLPQAPARVLPQPQPQPQPQQVQPVAAAPVLPPGLHGRPFALAGILSQLPQPVAAHQLYAAWLARPPELYPNTYTRPQNMRRAFELLVARYPDYFYVVAGPDHIYGVGRPPT